MIDIEEKYTSFYTPVLFTPINWRHSGMIKLEFRATLSYLNLPERARSLLEMSPLLPKLRLHWVIVRRRRLDNTNLDRFLHWKMIYRKLLWLFLLHPESKHTQEWLKNKCENQIYKFRSHRALSLEVKINIIMLQCLMNIVR